MMNNGLVQISEIYSAYDEAIRALRASLRPTDGLMGFGKRPGSDPCHGIFSQNLEDALFALAQTELSEHEAEEILRFILMEPKRRGEDRLSYWMLLAVHGKAEVLIPFLSPETAAALSASYRETYPKHSLLPVQKELLSRLEARGGNKERPKKRFGLFGR